MTLKQIIEVADEMYPDGLVGDYFRDLDTDHGDGLAKFIAVELKETYDESASETEQLIEAGRVLRVAASELRDVYEELERRAG